MAAAEADRLQHFRVDPERLDTAADAVTETMTAAYPDLDVPYHARWRHFVIAGTDRWQVLAAASPNMDPAERARVRFDLAVTSVLLDAGAGDAWRYRDSLTDTTLVRSEGLALASLDMFAAGAFSSDKDAPLRADAPALGAVTEEALAAGFQAGGNNPLVGLAGRAGLLRALGAALAERPDLFGDTAPRVGNLFDALAKRARDGVVTAEQVLAAVLDGFGSIWPGRESLAGINLGDVWRHPEARGEDMTDGLVPFHKLSQWLTYSLFEPLEEAGIRVTGVDALTGLAEYRNGGLLVDTGFLVPKHAGVTRDAHGPGETVIVEWRALTVVGLDRAAEAVRRKLGLDSGQLPLAKVLEGGTWQAGPRAAADPVGERRNRLLGRALMNGRVECEGRTSSAIVVTSDISQPTTHVADVPSADIGERSSGLRMEPGWDCRKTEDRFHAALYADDADGIVAS